MNKIINLLEKNTFSFLKCEEIKISPLWKKSYFYPKILTSNIYIENLNLDISTAIGGMCCIKTSSLETLDQIKPYIKNIYDLELWFNSWYPRIDQLHDCVGIPVKQCKNIIYILEDVIHADRIHRLLPKINKEEILSLLREVHRKQGHESLVSYLNFMGFKGNVSYIFLSEILLELKTAIKLAKVFGFKKQEEDKELLKIMYTSFYPIILGVKNGFLFEPIKYIERYSKNKYYSILDEIPIITFIPYLYKESFNTPHEKVISRNNQKIFIEDEDIISQSINFLFSKKDLFTEFDKNTAKQNLQNFLEKLSRNVYQNSLLK